MREHTYLDTKEQLIRVATTLFGEQGYAVVSIDQIVAAAKVSKGTFYYYFKTKEDILYEIHVRALTSMLEWANRIAEDKETPVDERFRDFMRAYVNELTARQAEGRILVENQRYLQGERWEEVRQQRKAFEMALGRLIEDGIQEGIFRASLQVRLATFQIVGAVLRIPEWYHLKGPLTPDQIADTFSDNFMNGFCVAEGQ
ncbi:MAG: TetR family transcriptional regulator [Firmicutes bacterium]|nr:TetR family transcriptional regulator [Bacillota bacterium]